MKIKTRTETKRQAILDVASKAFLELGFGQTSMSEIRARLGGSKSTLYKYFPSKEELFFEVIIASTETQFEAVHRALEASSGDIAESLRHFGENLLAFLYSPQIRAQRHLAISESRRSDLGRLMYERGVLRSQKLVTEFLREAMVSNKLIQADPVVATRHLYSLLESELLEPFLLQQLGEVSPEMIKTVTTRAIYVFMSAYGPRKMDERC